MSCTCPYAQSGENCKHMAAVLIYAERENLEDRLYEIDDNTKFDVLDSISKDELVAFLKEQLESNEKIRQAFTVRFIPTSVNTNSMIDDFNKLIAIHEGRDGFINYYQARKFFSDIDEFVERLVDMIDQELYQETAKVIAGAIKGFDSIPLDDSWT